MLLYFQVCSNSAYPQHAGERYRTNGPLVEDFEANVYKTMMPIFLTMHIPRTGTIFKKSPTAFYNAVTLNICFIKGSHKYAIYWRDKNKKHCS